MFATLATLPPTHAPERSPTAGDAARTHATASRPRVASAFNGRRAAAGAAQPALHFADRIRAAEAPRISPRVIGIAAAATIAVLLLGWLIFGRPDAEALALTALAAELGDPTSTTSGQRALVTLADGSIVRLGANATVRSSVSYGDGARAVVLQGPVSVSLGSGNEQPVAIATGANQWVTTGAVATFGQAGDHTLVVVDSGAIELVLDDKRERLESGQAVRVSTGGAIEPLDDATRATEFAWRDGRFVARAVALRDLRSPLLQWFDRELKLADGIAPDMAVSLDVPLDATDSLSAALARETGLNVTEEGRELRVVTPQPAASPAPVTRRPRRDLFLPPPTLPELRGGSASPF